MERGRMIFGAILVFIGIVFLLMNFGIIPDDFGKFWPVILIIIGAGMLLNDEKKKK
ncbi:MAG: DUF5668 domain-containing protein [Candidatus Micrarchaeota archaeon]